MKTIEKAIEDIKAHLIDLCKFPNYEEDNYNAGYIAAIDENTSEIFKEGVEFAQRWISVDDELPPCSDEDILIKGIDYRGIEGMCDIGYMHSSPNNIPKKENFIPLSGEIIKVTHWRPIELK